MTRISLKIAVLFLLAAGPARGGEEAKAPLAALCPDLGPVRIVSFKGQEEQLLSRLIKVSRESLQPTPDLQGVAAVFGACLAALQQAPSPSVGQGGSLGTPAPLRGIHWQIQGPSLRVGGPPEAGARTVLEFTLEGGLPAAARRITRRLAREYSPPGPERAQLENALWFLWIESFVRSLGSRFNSYTFADELAADRATQRGKSFAVGFHLRHEQGRFFLARILDERLERAGLRPGLELLALDGKPAASLDQPALSLYWLNPAPFSYHCDALVDGKPRRFAGDAVPVFHRLLEWAPWQDLAYLRIRGFSANTLVELRRSLRGIQARKAAGVILDLRRNPGGVFLPAVIDCFLRPGQTPASFLDHAPGSRRVDLPDSVEYFDLPAVALIDEKTTSMAETFVAALKTHSRALLVGRTTFGKGVGQSSFPILEEGTLHLVNRTYFYPGTQTSWNEAGIAPDFVIPIGAAELREVAGFLDAVPLRLEEQMKHDSALRRAVGVLSLVKDFLDPGDLGRRTLYAAPKPRMAGDVLFVLPVWERGLGLRPSGL